MIVLALDTALNACSACVAADGMVLASASEPMLRGHQERLAPMAAEVMARTGLSFAKLDRIGVVVGPGSFTGLRVGLAFAKGLSLALDIPCIGVGTLEALAASEHGLVAAAVAAKQGQVYLQVFVDGTPLMEPQALEPQTAADRVTELGAGRSALLTGPGASLLAPLPPGIAVAPRAAADVEAVARLVAGSSEALSRPAPIYLRAPDARTLAERADAR